MRKTTIDVQFRQKMNFLFQNILTFYCLNDKKKDVDKSETSYALTITVKLITVNQATGYVKYRTQSQSFIHSSEDLKNSKILAASLVCSVLSLLSNGMEPRDNCLAMQSCSSSSSAVFGGK